MAVRCLEFLGLVVVEIARQPPQRKEEPAVSQGRLTTMRYSAFLRHVFLGLSLFAAAVCWNGVARGQASEGDEADRPKPRDWGPPLVDDVASLKKLDPEQPVWLDSKNRQVVFIAELCQATYPLEFFATLRGRDYESVVVIEMRPRIIHAALLALGAQPGHPARFMPKYELPTGTEVAIEVRWKDAKGKRQQARAQDWLRNIKTGKSPEMNWVFGGSRFDRDDATGKLSYLADSGDFISVSNVPIATLDLPIKTSTAIEARLFEGFAERLPPRGTNVTVLLKPKLPSAK